MLFAILRDDRFAAIGREVVPNRAYQRTTAAGPVMRPLELDMMPGARGLIHHILSCALSGKAVRRTRLQTPAAVDAKLLFQHRIRRDRRISQDGYHTQPRAKVFVIRLWLSPIVPIPA